MSKMEKGRKPGKRAKPARISQGNVTVYSFVGNLGCVRFPEKIRKVSGIKRDDRLVVTVRDGQSIVLEKLDIPKSLASDSISNLQRVAACSCDEPPAACLKAEPALVTVGWSYVEIEEALAVQLGFLPGAAIKLVGETSRIMVSLHSDLRDLKDAKPVACPP